MTGHGRALSPVHLAAGCEQLGAGVQGVHPPALDASRRSQRIGLGHEVRSPVLERTTRHDRERPHPLGGQAARREQRFIRLQCPLEAPTTGGRELFAPTHRVVAEDVHDLHGAAATHSLIRSGRPPPRRVPTASRHRLQQQPGVLVLWVIEHLRDRTALNDPPALHHGDVVGDLPHHGEVVRDEQIAQPLRTPAGPPAGSAPAPARTRRAQPPPHRARAPAGGQRAPERSPPAGADHRTTRLGAPRRGGRRARPRPAAATPPRSPRAGRAGGGSARPRRAWTPPCVAGSTSRWDPGTPSARRALAGDAPRGPRATRPCDRRRAPCPTSPPPARPRCARAWSCRNRTHRRPPGRTRRGRAGRPPPTPPRVAAHRGAANSLARPVTSTARSTVPLMAGSPAPLGPDRGRHHPSRPGPRPHACSERSDRPRSTSSMRRSRHSGSTHGHRLANEQPAATSCAEMGWPGTTVSRSAVASTLGRASSSSRRVGVLRGARAPAPGWRPRRSLRRTSPRSGRTPPRPARGRG